MALKGEIEAQQRWRQAHFPPDLHKLMDLALQQLKDEAWSKRALQVGAALPSMQLKDINGAQFDPRRLVGRQPMIVSFFCGHWSLYCNIELRAFDALVPQIQDFGARFIPVITQSVELNISTLRCNRLNYPLFSDATLEAAATCGLLMTLPDMMIDALEQLGIDIPVYQGNAVLPMPANYLVDLDGRIITAHIDEDLRHRPEPEAMLQALRQLHAQRVY
ncbi:redoxin domain-containing protein [Pseudaeromonas sharmana]|uniref:Redoxin domain-containing protein n=1 Tax=Pseudaeromonas sharmana TaxID=328412 RepID=A0ABV8CL53_9GAMM